MFYVVADFPADVFSVGVFFSEVDVSSVVAGLSFVCPVVEFGDVVWVGGVHVL